MKGFRIIIFILSVVLLTISSGLLFYKNIFHLDTPAKNQKVNFEELRYTDLQINASAALLRMNLNSETNQLAAQMNRLNELLNIVTDVNKSTPELSSSIGKIQKYFDKKLIELNKLQMGLNELNKAVNALNPIYNELVQNKIKFSVDNKDFYRESLNDALLFISISSPLNEDRLVQDKKVLGQILNFANSPNPIIQKYSGYLDIILKRTKEINHIVEGFNLDTSINKELLIVGKYYQESIEAKARDAEIYLTMIYGAIVLYLLTIIFILKKMT
jgi:hypothetical protein